MIEKRYIFTRTLGHGYLRVPASELREVNVFDLISEYSFLNGDCVELEEDVDAPLFASAAAYAGWRVEVDEREVDDLPLLPRFVSSVLLN
jgi:hypothetical protein